MNDRFGHAETVHPFAQHFDRLGQGAGPLLHLAELVGVHFDQERGAALQIQAELDLARCFLLQSIEHRAGRVLLRFHIEGEIAGDFVGADGLFEDSERRPIGILLLELFGLLQNVGKHRVPLLAQRFFLEDFDDIPPGGRIHLEGRPGDHEDNEEEFPEMVSIHGVRLRIGRAGFTSSFGDFGDGGFKNFQLGIGGADCDGFIFDTDHNTHNTAAGHDFIPAADGLHHRVVLLGLSLLRADKDEVKNENHQKERKELNIPGRTRPPLARLGGHG